MNKPFRVRDLTGKVSDSYHLTENEARQWSAHLTEWNAQSRFVIERVEQPAFQKPPINSLIRFRSTGHEATVTEHTARGFKYLLAREYSFIPRWNMSFSGEGEIYTDMPELEWHLREDIQIIEAFSEPVTYTQIATQT